jgi:excisionase family DNA binding protein
VSTHHSDLDDLMRVEEAAKLFDWHPDTLWAIIRAGDIDVVRIGAGRHRKQTRITRRAVLDYIDRNTKRATPNKPKRPRAS